VKKTLYFHLLSAEMLMAAGHEGSLNTGRCVCTLARSSRRRRRRKRRLSRSGNAAEEDSKRKVTASSSLIEKHGNSSACSRGSR